jgi:hypothetical protein
MPGFGSALVKNAGFGSALKPVPIYNSIADPEESIPYLDPTFQTIPVQ